MADLNESKLRNFLLWRSFAALKILKHIYFYRLKLASLIIIRCLYGINRGILKAGKNEYEATPFNQKAFHLDIVHLFHTR